jgi:hypothetical protein
MAAVSLRRNFSPPRNRLLAALEPADFRVIAVAAFGGVVTARALVRRRRF